jgi:hypothetical protein
MMRTMNVLVVESHPHAADAAAAALEDAGHRVHRCYDKGAKGFPCRGILDPAACPLESSIDVALVVRRHINPRPTRLEDGVRCAIRAGVPIVEDGTEVLDPYTPWIAQRLGPHADVVQACRLAASGGLEPLYTKIHERIAALLTSVAIDPASIRCRIEPSGHRLDVHLELPVVVTRGMEQALAVRVLDAVRSSGRTFGNVDVHVHPMLQGQVLAGPAAPNEHQPDHSEAPAH